MTRNGEHRWDDELPAYALGALDRAEVSELERHLADCPRCGERLRWLQSAIDVLPASVEQVEPPAGLKQTLMATVRKEGRQARGKRRHWWRPEGRVSFRVRPALALLAAGLLVAGVAGYGISAALRDSGGDRIVAEATPDAPGARAVLDRQGEGIDFRVEQLPALSKGDVYELWVQVGDGVQPSGTFKVAADGTGYARIASLPDGAQAVLVTREPRGGSSAPTSPVLLHAPLS